MKKLSKHYLDYPQRNYGMDHDYYDWSLLEQRPKISWPGEKELAVFINLNVEFYPLNQEGIPFKVPGGMKMPYPDLRHFTLREYGNRIGIYRILEVLDRYGITPSCSVNGQIVDRNPQIVRELMDRGCEIIGHGWNMDRLHYGGMDRGMELESIHTTITKLENAFQKPIKAWLSPAKSQSENTPELLKESGIDVMMDWVNDELPYPFRTKYGPITAFSLSTELEDKFVIMNNLHSEEQWVTQVLDAYEFLSGEASELGGRLLTINIHSWLLGQAHRIKYLDQLINILSRKKNLFWGTAQEIVDFSGISVAF